MALNPRRVIDYPSPLKSQFYFPTHPQSRTFDLIDLASETRSAGSHRAEGSRGRKIGEKKSLRDPWSRYSSAGWMARSPLARSVVAIYTRIHSQCDESGSAVCHYGWPHFIYNNWLETVTWFWLKVGTVWNL